MIHAEAHGDAGGEAGFCTVGNAIKDDLSVVLLRFQNAADRTVEQGIGKRGGKRCDMVCALLPE